MPEPDLDYGAPRDDAELRACVTIMAEALLPPDDPRSVDDLTRSFSARGASVRVVRARGAVAGGLVSVRAAQWFGGKLVPSNAVAAVAIAPEHRGRGAAAHLMRSLVAELRDDGVALSALYPATQTVYRRAGYELAGSHFAYAAPTRSMLVDASAAAQVQARSMVGEDADNSADRARIEAARRARLRDAQGPFERSEYLWNRALLVGKHRVYRYILEDTTGCVGYAVVTHRKEPRGHAYDVVLNDHVALTRAAALRILSLVAAHRSMGRAVTFSGAPAEPLLYVLPEQEDVAVERRTEWLLRVVDVERALAARGYPRHARAELHFEVRDPHVPANDGRFVLEVEGGEARVRRGGRGALRLDVLGVAPLYTGHMAAHDLRRVGALAGDDDQVEEAAALFAGPTPWMPEKF